MKVKKLKIDGTWYYAYKIPSRASNPFRWIGANIEDDKFMQITASNYSKYCSHNKIRFPTRDEIFAMAGGLNNYLAMKKAYVGGEAESQFWSGLNLIMSREEKYGLDVFGVGLGSKDIVADTYLGRNIIFTIPVKEVHKVNDFSAFIICEKDGAVQDYQYYILGEGKLRSAPGFFICTKPNDLQNLSKDDYKARRKKTCLFQGINKKELKQDAKRIEELLREQTKSVTTTTLALPADCALKEDELNHMIHIMSCMKGDWFNVIEVLFQGFPQHFPVELIFEKGKMWIGRTIAGMCTQTDLGVALKNKFGMDLDIIPCEKQYFKNIIVALFKLI